MKWKVRLDKLMDTYRLHIPPNTQQNETIFLPEHAPDIDIIVGQHASIMLHHIQQVSTEITIRLKPHARVHFVQTLAQEHNHQTTIICYQEGGSTFIFNGRYDYTINATLNLFLLGQQAHATISCIIDAQDSTQSSFNTLQMHQAPHTSSNFLLKGLLQNHAHSKHTGMIRIDAEAHNSDATLQSRYLLIGNHAQAYTEPQLEVLNKQVSCFHGSAIGSCNDDDLFYLATRGLNKEYAQQLICDAFLSVPDGL